MTSSILVNHKGAVATITLNRPGQRNAISYAMWGELSQILTQLDADREVRAVVITGAGEEAFSAGADINDFEEHRSDSTKGHRYNAAVNGLLETLDAMATPTISMIRGFAVGGEFSDYLLGVLVHGQLQGPQNRPPTGQRRAVPVLFKPGLRHFRGRGGS